MSAASRRAVELGYRTVYPGDRVQVFGRAVPGTVREVGAEPAAGVARERELKVAFDGESELAELREADVAAVWPADTAGDGRAFAPRLNTQLTLIIRPAAYRQQSGIASTYVVQEGAALPHAGFDTAEDLKGWMAERGLSIDGEVPPGDEHAVLSIEGSYRETRWLHSLGFDELEGIRTRVWSNGRITAAMITCDEDGMRTVHHIASNCLARQEYDRFVAPCADDKLYFYVPGSSSAIDVVTAATAQLPPPEMKGVWGGETFAQMRKAYPALQIMSARETHEQIRDVVRMAPEEITQEQFDDALGCMPPVDSCRRQDAHTFKLSELYSLDIATIFARVDGRFFRLRDHHRLSHDEIVQRVRESASMKAAPAFDDEPAGMTP